MQNRTDVIFAPHVDDEVIGCWKILNAQSVSDVYYFFDASSKRCDEALACAAKFGFTPHFVTDATELTSINFSGKTLHIPNIKDAHIQHKMVNYIGRKLPCTDMRFYSIDMNVQFNVLTSTEQREKRADLLELFPSQEKLLTSTDKYFLFESSLVKDYSSLATYRYDGISLTVGTEFEQDYVIEILKKIKRPIDFNTVVTNFVGSTVELTYGVFTWKFDPN